MKSISTILLALSIIGISEFIYADYFHHPKEGYVPDAKTAIKVAVAIWEPIYGAQQINEQAPYSANLQDGVWTVKGSLPGPKEYIDEDGNKMGSVTAGGVAVIKIDKQTGCIIMVSHGK